MREQLSNEDSTGEDFIAMIEMKKADQLLSTVVSW